MSQASTPQAADMVDRGSRRRLWRNTGFSLVQQVVSISLAIFLLPFMLWRLGPEQYGLWLILQIFNILGMISLAELGLQGAIVRHLARYHAMGDRAAFRHLLASGLLLFLGIGLVAFAAVAAFAQTVFVEVFAIPAEKAGEMKLALSVYAAGLVINFPALVLKSFFAGLQNIAFQKIWETLDRLIFTAVLVPLLLATDRLLYLVLLEQAVALLMLTGFALFAWRRYGKWFTIDPRQARLSSLRGVIGLSGAVFTTNLTNQVFVKGPEALVGAILGPVLLAYYQIATRLPRVLKSLQGALNAAVLPHMAGLDTGETEADEPRRRFALKGLRINYLVFVPGAIAMMLFAPAILTVWVGQGYAFLATYLVMYALWQSTAVAVNFVSATLTRTDHYRWLIRHSLFTAMAFVAVLAIGLGSLGLGMLFGALLVSGLWNAAAAVQAARQAHGLSYRAMAREALLGPVFGSAMLGILFLAPASLVLQHHGTVAGIVAAMLAGLAYAAGWYRLVLRQDERGWIKAAIAKLRPKG